METSLEKKQHGHPHFRVAISEGNPHGTNVGMKPKDEGDTLYNRVFGWFMGPSWAGEQKVENYWVRRALEKCCVPAAAVSGFISWLAYQARTSPNVPREFMPTMAKPYAAQVLGVIVGFLLVMRLTQGMRRWNNGMIAAQEMEGRWGAAYVDYEI